MYGCRTMTTIPIESLTNMGSYPCEYEHGGDHSQDGSACLPEIEAFLDSSSDIHGEQAVRVREGDVMSSDPFSDAQYCDMDQGSGLDAELEKVHSLVIREVIRDVCLACRLLDLPIDPTYWKIDHVEKWLLWTIHEYNIQPINFDYFKMNGINLCMLSEDDFRARAPHCGDIIHAQLEIWRIAAKMNINEQQSFRQTTNTTFFQDQEFMDTSMSPSLDTSGTDSASDDESVQSPVASHTSMTPNHTTNIHLWQFLKELLLQPERYGGCIRWLNREEGIFKIEDSVEVAKLWGTRKNRPAMNYDKLSRSIRQYYKKGIIKKTDVSQRLVYQFVKREQKQLNL